MTARLTALVFCLSLLLQAQFIGGTTPRLIRRVDPVYPPLAKTMRIQGTVHLAAVIDEDGTVAALKLISGHPFLVKAAMDAARQFQYRPSMRGGHPVRAVIPIDVTFHWSFGESGKATRV
ncbi:exported hypothetical protein [Candidatus Sulfopaludibacter sp. SbA3]|nr:exported hypothetical protein [Candidatus Sulfopaludibacter sp. SbA3]